MEAIAASSPPETPTIEQELGRRGVSAAKAEKLAREHPAEKIEGKLQVFDWLAAKDDKRVAKSPAGYLVKSIEDDYSPPKGFITKAERTQREEAKQAKEHKAAEERRRKQAADAQEQAEQQAVLAYWNALSPQEQAELDARLEAEEDPAKLAMQTGPLKNFGRIMRRHPYIRQLLQDQGKLPAAEG